MKKFLLIVLLYLPFFTIAQTQLKISADIRGHACSGGFGLCSAVSIAEKINSTISAQKISDTTILFIIDKASLSIENQKSIVGKELSKVTSTEKLDFVQEVNIAFDLQTLLKLGFDSKYSIIKTGNYPMIIEKDKVLVTFTLTER